MPKSTLGSYISSINHRSKRKGGGMYQDDLLSIQRRLEGYKAYQDRIKREQHLHKEKEKRKVQKKIKKAFYKKIYSYKPILNPYVAHYQRNQDRIDPNLLKRYVENNIFMLYEFRHLTLPRTNYKITAGQAVGGLKKAWTGFYRARRLGSEEEVKYYAAGLQKWNYLLEVPIIPDFSAIGLPELGYKYPSLEFND